MSRSVPTKKKTTFSATDTPHNTAKPPADGSPEVSFWCDVRPFFLLGVAALLLFFSSPSWANSPKLSFLIGKIARQEGLDPNLLSAVVATESQFDVVSVSIRGAVGLMQLMPDTARELGVANRFNPEQNLRGGARYLRRLMERYPEDLSLALAAYNAGPTAVIRFGGVPPFPETKRYISKVLGRYAKMVPGRDTPPKKSSHHIKRPVGKRITERARPIVNTLKPVRNPKMMSASNSTRRSPVRRAASPKKRNGETPVIRLSRR